MEIGTKRHGEEAAFRFVDRYGGAIRLTFRTDDAVREAMGF